MSNKVTDKDIEFAKDLLGGVLDAYPELVINWEKTTEAVMLHYQLEIIDGKRYYSPVII